VRASFLPASAALVLALLAACGGPARVESDVEDLRLRLERTRCLNRMDSLAFRIQGLVLDVEEPGRSDVDSVSVLLGDSLTTCPASGLPYSLRIEEGEIVVVCPEGHGRKGTELL
jgi:hypothetical protein